MNGQPILQVIFFHNPSGREPVREWLKEMDKADRAAIGEDIKLVQFRWPLGMPLVWKLEADLLGSAQSSEQRAYCACLLYGTRNGDGLVAWLYQEVTEHTWR